MECKKEQPTKCGYRSIDGRCLYDLYKEFEPDFSCIYMMQEEKELEGQRDIFDYMEEDNG